MRALTLERWAHDPGPDTADPLSTDPEAIPYVFTWTDTANPADLQPYAFTWNSDDQEKEGDTAAPNWKAGFQGVAAGAGTGAAMGAALGTVFPGIGNAIGGTIGGAVGAIGGFFAGLFGGGSSPPKPTPRWIIDILEEGRRALTANPPNPYKLVDATLVMGGRYSREGYLRAKRAGQLPSQQWERNRAAALARGRRLNIKYGPKIAEHLKDLAPGEKAIVSAAMPLGQGEAALEAVNAIRAQKQRAAEQPSAFPPDIIEMLRRQYLAVPIEQRDYMPPRPAPEPMARPLPAEPMEPPSRTTAPSSPIDPSTFAPEITDIANDIWRGLDTSAPSAPAPSVPSSPQATAPTLANLPKPAWHVSPPVMPRHVFERILYLVPALKQIPRPLLRAMVGKGSRVQDTSGIDATTRQYVMMPGETFAGIARQLTGDASRAVELAAANPNHAPGRMRLEIPPGWIEWTPLVHASSETAAPTTEIKPDPEPSIDDEPKKPAKPATPAKPPAAPQARDGQRPNITQRVIEVLANDWPENIANRTGAKKSDPQWFRTLRRANPHKALAENGNFKTLYAGELLNYPDTWPAHIEAKPAPGQNAAPSIPTTPNPGPVPPPIGLPPIPQLPQLPIPIPTGGTADPGSTLRAQTILAIFALKHPEIARPQDYGRTPADLTGSPTDRMRSVLSTFQLWWNTRKPAQMLRVDGVLDSATDAALTTYAEEAIKDVPIPSVPNGGGTVPQNGGTTPSPNGGGTPAPSGGGGPWIPSIPTAPWIQVVAPSAETPPQQGAQSKSNDDGIAPLMIGGTVLSFLLR